MSEHSHRQTVPRAALWAAFTLILVSMGLAAGARRHNLQVAAQQPWPVRQKRRSTFALRTSPMAESPSSMRPPGDRFTVCPHAAMALSGASCGLFRVRKLEALERDQSFRLSRESDGRLTLADPQTGRRIDLGSFGPTNQAAFADILQAAQAVRP